MGRRREHLVADDVAQELRRLLIQSDEPWLTGSTGREIVSGKDQKFWTIGSMDTCDDARLVVLMKENFIPILTEYMLLCRELQDAERQIADLSASIQRIAKEDDPERV